MTRIDGSKGFKATESGTESSTSIAESKARLEEALEKIMELEEFDEFLSTEQLFEIKRLKTTIKAISAGLDGYAMNPTSGTGSSSTATGGYEMRDLEEPGWNGVEPTQEADDKAMIESDPSGAYGDYLGTVESENNGDSSHITGFQMDDTMEAVYAETRGRDIILTVHYTDGKVGSYVMKNAAIRPEPIIISAKGVDRDVTIDCSRVIRINDGSFPGSSYKLQKMFIFGGNGNDTLKASNNRAGDVVVGGMGDDTIYGGIGDDVLMGGLARELNGTTASEIGYTENDGDDVIYGGGGANTIYGGTGLDTPGDVDDGDLPFETERDPIEGNNAAAPDPSSFISGTGWDASVDSSDDGTIIVQKNDMTGGTLDISMPSGDGYDSVFAERTSDNALKLTFVGKDEFGNTKTFTVIVENFFELSAGIDDPTSIPRLTFHGGSGNDIIDFRVQLDNQVINIVDDQGGNDIILGPTSDVVSSGLNLDDLLSSQGHSGGSLSSILGESDSEYYEDQGVTASAQSDPAQIVIEDADGDPSTEVESLGIDVPEGYDKGYITSDADGNLYVILVKKSSDGKTKSIVYKIDKSLTEQGGTGGLLTWKDISAGSLDLVPISNLAPDPITGVTDYTLDAGTDGDDFVLYQDGWTAEDDKDEKKKYKG